MSRAGTKRDRVDRPPAKIRKRLFTAYEGLGWANCTAEFIHIAVQSGSSSGLFGSGVPVVQIWRVMHIIYNIQIGLHVNRAEAFSILSYSKHPSSPKTEHVQLQVKPGRSCQSIPENARRLHIIGYGVCRSYLPTRANVSQGDDYTRLLKTRAGFCFAQALNTVMGMYSSAIHHSRLRIQNPNATSATRI